MRPVYDTTNPSTASAPVQLYSIDTAVHLYSITIKARTSNAANFYFGFDSGVTNTNGYELLPGDAITVTASDIVTPKSATFKANSLWANSTSTSGFIDWLMLLED